MKEDPEPPMAELAQTTPNPDEAPADTVMQPISEPAHPEQAPEVVTEQPEEAQPEEVAEQQQPQLDIEPPRPFLNDFKSLVGVRDIHEKTFVPLLLKDKEIVYNPLVDKLVKQAIQDQNVELRKLDDFDEHMLDNDDASENMNIRTKVVLFRDIELSDVNDETFDELLPEPQIIEPEI